jgi:hypothetical protein
MPTLLIVHHTPSPTLQAMFEAAADGARTDEIEGVDVLVRPALTASEVDVLAADGYLLVESITTGLGWRLVRPAVSVTGTPGKADLEACWELGAKVSAELST